MSKSVVKLVSLILREHFGDVVEKVGSRLASHGPALLRELVHVTKLPLNQVKKSLCVLIQHSIVSTSTNKRGMVEYTLDSGCVLLRLRFARFIYCAKTLYGDTAELIVEELLKHGYQTMSQVIKTVVMRLNESLNGSQTMSPGVVHEKFSSLVMTHFLQRVNPTNTGTTVAASSQEKEKHLYDIPNINLSKLSSRKRKLSDDSTSSSAKKPRCEAGNDELCEDSGIYWRVNLSRFHQYFRDQAIISATENVIDKMAAEVVRTILRLSEVKTDPSATYTSPVSCHEILSALPKDVGMRKADLEQYLTLLVGDSTSYVTKSGDSGGGMYSIHFERAAISLCKAHIESVIQERFGSKCLRIFRLLMINRRVEQQQIESAAMIPAKEAKEMLYNMFSERFISVTEVSRTPDHAPSRTFYLFSVNINQLTRMLLDRCFKALSNVKLRHTHETKEHRRLLEKSQRVEAIAASVEQSGGDMSQREEIEEMITPPERVLLAKVKHMSNKLEQSEIQLDESVFVLQMYLDYVSPP